VQDAPPAGPASGASEREIRVSFEYGPLQGDAGEMLAIAEILSWAFAFPAADAEPWMTKAGRENIRVLRKGKEIVATLVFVPMGQFFGGRRVPMVGVAGVATAPEHRGGGVATALMRSAVLDLHASGAPISTLFPATRPLYRRAGYEPAGCRFDVRIPVRGVSVKERGLTVRLMKESDRDAVVRLYREHAASRPGHLDRGSYIWSRVTGPRNQTARGYVIEQEGRVDGYVYLYLQRAHGYFFDVHVTDAVTRSAASTRRLLGFLMDHLTNGRDLYWRSGPADTLLQALPEVGFRIESEDHWMLRVVDVRKALAERGYLEGLEAELHLDVRDDLIPENQGRFVLSVSGGQGTVKKGGRGRLKLDVRGLAPLYTGHLHPAALAAAGLLEGAEADLRKAAAVFAGPAPWMPDMF
jgi:predicted acetyltransferase